MFKKTSKGFTLIELLVVIAIIGVLASVVLASLNSARNKAKDSAIKANLANIRAQAEIIYDSQSCYGDNDGGTTCAAFALGDCTTGTNNTLFNDSTIWGQISAAKTASGSGSISSCVEPANGSAWAVAVQLKTDTKKAWCVDSNGASKEESDAAAYVQATLDADITDASGNPKCD